MDNFRNEEVNVQAAGLEADTQMSISTPDGLLPTAMRKDDD